MLEARILVAIMASTLLYCDSPSAERAAMACSLVPVSSFSSLNAACRPSRPGRCREDRVTVSGGNRSDSSVRHNMCHGEERYGGLPAKL